MTFLEIEALVQSELAAAQTAEQVEDITRAWLYRLAKEREKKGRADMQKDIWMLIADLAEADGVVPVNKLPGLWERRIDAHWELAVNGHNSPLKWDGRKKAMSVTIAPYRCAIRFNGWLAGLFDPNDGIIAAGTIANQDSFEQAVKAAINGGR